VNTNREILGPDGEVYLGEVMSRGAMQSCPLRRMSYVSYSAT